MFKIFKDLTPWFSMPIWFDDFSDQKSTISQLRKILVKWKQESKQNKPIANWRVFCQQISKYLTYERQRLDLHTKLWHLSKVLVVADFLPIWKMRLHGHSTWGCIPLDYLLLTHCFLASSHQWIKGLEKMDMDGL